MDALGGDMNVMQIHHIVRPERSRGACVMSPCERPSTSLGTNEFLWGVQ
jgi:hypothetical protein